MSHFFSSSKQENSSKPQKNYQSDSTESEKSHKKTDKLTILKEKLSQTLANPTNKSVDKAIKSIHRNVKLIKDKQFLIDFYNSISAAKKVSSSTKSKLKEMIDQMNEEIKLEIKKEKRKISLQEQILEILNFKEVNDKLRKLEQLSWENKAERFKILLTKVLILLQNNILCDLLNCFVEMKELFKEKSLIFNDFDLKNLFVSQFGMYFNFLMTYQEDSLINELALLLSDINKEIVERKVLEYKYFVKNDFIQTELFEFKLLSLVKNDKLEESILFYEKNKEIFDLEDEVVKKGLVEFGKKCFDTKKYFLSFEVLQRVYYFDKSEEDLLFVNCVVIPSQVKNERFFEYFLESFLRCENEMLLSSCKSKNEIFRAFFLKENGFYDQSEEILLKCGYKVEVERSGTFMK
ncbi:hypothetical protein TUBRATIS_003050 [Tubulinosema ratisbonensis]|uniref:Uncharacterized protein n=1 Tax=Tubulinosema ratisbonensis TaxID=291195 RepID=A0A437APV0_9MICR|nr:hypothetical protein TUBRATIS_003050 [Tubulinosema ratisbonensis]